MDLGPPAFPLLHQRSPPNLPVESKRNDGPDCNPILTLERPGCPRNRSGEKFSVARPRLRGQ